MKPIYQLKKSIKMCVNMNISKYYLLINSDFIIVLQLVEAQRLVEVESVVANRQKA